MFNPRENMTFGQYVKSYKNFLDKRIKFFKLFKQTYKNYPSVIIHVLRRKYPFSCILKNGTTVTYNKFSEIYYTLQKLDYDNKDESITISLKNSSKKIKLLGVGNSGDIHGIFLKEEYSFLPVNNNIVIDIGANIGDSTLYFCLRGARKVIAIAPLKTNCEMAKINIEKNGFSEKVEILLAGCSDKSASITSELDSNKIQKIPLMTLSDILEKYDIQSAVLKMDCEGCEYNSILSSPKETLRKFTNIQIEYHYGYKNLKAKLEKCDFKVSVTDPKYLKSFTLNDTTVSIHNKKNSSEYVMSKKPMNPKKFIGWVYATRN